MNDPDTRRPSTTEETAATPGWVESELDEILAELPARPAIAQLGRAYLDCLAASGGPHDAEAARDRCRRTFLGGLEQDGIAPPARSRIEAKLEAMEAEISTRT